MILALLLVVLGACAVAWLGRLSQRQRELERADLEVWSGPGRQAAPDAASPGVPLRALSRDPGGR